MKLRSNGKSSDTVQRFGEQATTLVQTIAEQAATTATAGAGRAKEMSATFAAAAKERTPDRAEVSEQVSAMQQKFTEEIAPTAREVALQAASLALDLWNAGRIKAAEAAGRQQKGITAQASNVTHKAGRKASDAAHAVTGRVTVVTDTAGDAAQRAKSASKQAAETTVHTTKDTGAFVIWLGAAAGVVYFALLDEKRRNQVLRFASNSLKQLRKMVDGMMSEPAKNPEAQ